MSYFNREIEKQEGYKLVEVFADRGITGTSLKRPKFEQMLYDAGLDIMEVSNQDKDGRKNYKRYVTIPSSTRKPKFDLILVKNTSRFARNVLVEAILRDLKQNKVYVHFLDLNKTTKNDDDITYIQIFQSFDERESRDKSKKVKFGHREGSEKGVIMTNNTIYGYNYIQEDNRLEIIPEEAKVIQKIYELYCEEYGIRRIINYLTENKLFTRGGKPFCKSTIRRILTNEKYAGISARLKYDTGAVFSKNSYPKVTPEDGWIKQKSDKIPSIIGEELFYKCRTILQGKVNHKQRKGVYNGTTQYAGLMYCGVCGNPYHGNMDKGRRFYNCKLKKSQGTEACSNANVSEIQLNEAINEKEFKRVLSKYKLIYATVLENMQDELKNRINGNDDETVIDLKAKHDATSKYEEKLLDLYMDGNISKEMYAKKFEAVKAQKEELKADIERLSKPNEQLQKDIEDIGETIEKINNIEIKKHYTQEEILEEIEKLIVKPKKKIEVSYKIKSYIIALCQKHDIDIFLDQEAG